MTTEEELNTIPGSNRIVTVKKMEEIEKQANDSGHTYDSMMAEAGKALAASIQKRSGQFAEQSLLFLVGPGKNGGDTLISARHLSDSGASICVYLWKRSNEPDGDPHLAALLDRELLIVNSNDDPDQKQLASWLENTDLVVDGLLGTGVNRPLEGEIIPILESVRAESLRREKTKSDPLFVVAVDLPSGVNGSDGSVDEHTLYADLTITFGHAKVGHFHFPGAARVGELEVADIGLAPEFAADESTYSLDREIVGSLLPERSRDSHKGSFGKVMLIAGSVNYPGAAYLSSAAAGRAGAGLVTGAVAQPIWAPIAGALPEVTWILLPHELGSISESAVDPINTKLANYDAVLLGCGLGQEETTRRFIERFLSREKSRRSAILSAFGAQKSGSVVVQEQAAESEDEGAPFGLRPRARATSEKPPELPPIVIDADGLNLLAQIESWPDLLPASSVLTPHPAEMGRLCGLEVSEVIERRWELAREKAAEWKTVVLLKGPYTVIAHEDGRLAVLPVATPALATAGTGDVLAGTIAGLMAQGLTPFDAACAGAWIHGQAGLLCESEIGRAGVVAGDLLGYLPTVLAEQL